RAQGTSAGAPSAVSSGSAAGFARSPAVRGSGRRPAAAGPRGRWTGGALSGGLTRQISNTGGGSPRLAGPPGPPFRNVPAAGGRCRHDALVWGTSFSQLGRPCARTFDKFLTLLDIPARVRAARTGRRRKPLEGQT